MSEPMGGFVMRRPTTRLESSVASLVVAGVLISMTVGSARAQAPAQEECKANECFAPEFDVGVVSPALIGQYGITALMYAVEINDLAKVEASLASDADVNAQNETGATALLMAAAYGSTDMVNRLLAAGADPNIAGDRGDTPLTSAIQANHLNIAVALLNHGADPKALRKPDNPHIRTDALVRAAVLGQMDVVELLLKLGVDTPENLLEALSLALWKHHEDIVALLLENDIDLNVPTYDTTMHTRMQTGELVLQTAAQEGLRASTALLLEKGANVNGRNVHGASALHFAVREGHPEVVALLLNAGATIVSNDVSAAIDIGNEATTKQLMLNLNISALETADIETLIMKADRTNNTEFLNRLFSERELRIKTEPVTTLLFAKADTDDCELVLWDFAENRREPIFSSPGHCDQGFFFSKKRSELYVVDGLKVRVISLDAPKSAGQLIELPTAMIDNNLAALRDRVSVSFAGHDVSWMTAQVVQVGVLESGEFAFVTHSHGPADGAYGYLYAKTNNAWRLVRKEDCHRFDPCYFEEVLSHSLHERPNNMAAWSPEMRRNPYFVDKIETAVMDYEYISWNGVITLNIDGQQLQLHYGKGESTHCAENCVYSSGLSLALPDRDTVKIANVSGNNAIVDRYALVWTRQPNRSELIDLGTGKSVFGEFQIASWLH